MGTIGTPRSARGLRAELRGGAIQRNLARERAFLGFSEETSQASSVRSRGFRWKGNELLLVALVIEAGALIGCEH